jgi:hypothetical protein
LLLIIGKRPDRRNKIHFVAGLQRSAGLGIGAGSKIRVKPNQRQYRGIVEALKAAN